MSFELPSSKETFRVAIFCDSALDMTREDFEVYLQSGSEEMLKLKDKDKEPTWIVMRKSLNYSSITKLKTSQFKFEKGGDAKIQLGYIWEEVRCHIVDVINPSYVPEENRIKFVKAADGGASEEFIAGLEALGVVVDLFTVKNAVLAGSKQEVIKKK